MALTKIDDRGLKTPIDLQDNEKIRLGTGNDLEIYHNGNQNYINTSNGSIELRHTVGGANEPMIKAFPNGQVQLMYDSATKLDTMNTGISVTGGITASGSAYFGGGDVSINVASNVMDFIDNFALRLGNSQDFALYHNGTDSVIDNSTGNLKIIAPNDVEAIKIFNDGTVNIGNNADNIKLRFGIGSDLNIFHDGTNSILDNNTGDLILRSDGDDVKILAEDDIVLRDNDDSTNFVNCINGGAVELYHNGTKKFETTSAGVEVFGDIKIDDANKGVEVGDIGNDNYTKFTHEIAANSGDPIRGFVAQNNNGGILENLQGGTNQFLVLGDTDKDQSDKTLFGVSVNSGSTYYKRLDLTGTGILTLANGIKFNNDTAAANKLDDYEEGTWTPILDGSTYGGNSQGYLSRVGNYTKVGNLVTVSCYLTWNNFNGTGHLQIAGLPFTVLNSNTLQHAGPVMLDNLNWPSGTTQLATHNWYGITYFRLYGSSSGSSWAAVQCDSAAGVICTMTYFAA